MDPWGRMTDPSRGKSVKEGRAPINRYTSLNTICLCVAVGWSTETQNGLVRCKGKGKGKEFAGSVLTLLKQKQTTNLFLM